MLAASQVQTVRTEDTDEMASPMPNDVLRATLWPPRDFLPQISRGARRPALGTTFIGAGEAVVACLRLRKRTRKK